jgi:hypothetical protein
MYCIHDYISDSNPIIASEEAFEGVRNDIRLNIQKHISFLKMKYEIEQAFVEFLDIIKKEEIYQVMAHNTSLAKKQLLNEYTDPLMTTVINFNLDNEIKLFFVERWQFIPKILCQGKQPPAQH